MATNFEKKLCYTFCHDVFFPKEIRQIDFATLHLFTSVPQTTLDMEFINDLTYRQLLFLYFLCRSNIPLRTNFDRHLPSNRK